MRLLLVEDKDSFRRLLVQALGSAWEVTAVGDPAAALAAMDQAPFEILVTDLRLPGMSGLELLKAAKRRHPALRAVLMSAFGEPRDIVEAMRWGADDFLPKPFDLDQFEAVLERTRALAEAPPPDPREPWIVHSPAMRELDLALSRAADTDVKVLFQGEPGTGKGRSARRLHALRHPQAPYLCLSAPSLPPEGPDPRRLALLQGGSIFLSELEDLAEGGWGPLVRAMDSELGQGIHWLGSCLDQKTLAEPLRLRLGVIVLSLPPLRERREDILPMFRAFLDARARQDGRPVPGLARGVEKDVLQGAWPGNLNQLAWAVAQAWRASSGPLLAPLPDFGPEAGALVLPWPEPGTLAAMLVSVTQSAEAALLRKAMEGHREDPARVAHGLGLAPRRLAGMLRDHHISMEEE
ncbi:MAG: response regulator [Holophaga sp.]|nr:response regulator [Holophaga sp.]